jgi:hypothetical protein
MGAEQKTVGFLRKHADGVIWGFVSWVIKTIIIIIIASFLISGLVHKCKMDEETFREARQNMSKGFGHWADGTEKFEEILRKTQELLGE